MYSRDDLLCCGILDSVNKIIEISKGMDSSHDLRKNYILFDAIMMNFIIIGEISGKLSEEFKQKHIEIEWNKIYSFRNLIAHDYFGVDEILVWQIIQSKIPVLKNKIELLLHVH